MSVYILGQGKFVIQPHPVRFNEEPHNWTVTKGASVNLTCNTTVVQVIGYINEDTTPLPQIRWFHNNVMIDNSTDHFSITSYGIDTSILTIRNVTLLEQGEYHCVVNEWVKPDGDDWWTKTRSRSGSITGNGSLIVHNLYPYALLHIVTDNSSMVVVNSKENIILSCVEPTATVSSSGVEWIKDGVGMNETVRVITTMVILCSV